MGFQVVLLGVDAVGECFRWVDFHLERGLFEKGGRVKNILELWLLNFCHCPIIFVWAATNIYGLNEEQDRREF